MANLELEAFDSFLSQLPETPRIERVVKPGEDIVGNIISEERKSFLLKQYVGGLTHPFKAFRNEFSLKAMENIRDPAERFWVTEKVREISKAKEYFRRQHDAKAGYWQRFKDRGTENLASLIEGMTEVKESFIGPNRLFGGKFSQEDIQFRRGLESAKLSENPFLSKEAGTLTKGVVGAGKLIPDVAGGGISFVAGGPAGMMAYAAMRVIPEAVERHQESGLSGTAAGIAGGIEGAGTGLLEIAFTRDPTGFLKKASSPLALAARKAIAEFAKKTFPKVTQKGGAALAKKLKTKEALKELSDYVLRASGETIEEGGQGAWEASVEFAATLLEDSLDPVENYSIPKAFIRDIKESALPIALIGTAGPIIRATGADKTFDFEEVIRKHEKAGTTPSRSQWRQGGQPAMSKEKKAEQIPSLVREFNIHEQVFAKRTGDPISQKQHDRWDLPEEAGKTSKEWGEFIGLKEQAGLESESQEVAEIQEQSIAQQEAARLSQEAIPDPRALEVAPEQQAVPEAPEVIQEGVDLSKKADINNAAGEAWLREEGIKQIPDRDHGPGFRELIGSVIVAERSDKNASNALKLANDIVYLKRLTDDRDHVKLAVGAGKIKEMLKNLRVKKTVAIEKKDELGYDRIRRNEEELLENMNLILQASKYSGTVVSRALSIRRLLENMEETFDKKSVISRVQKARGGRKATKEQLKGIHELTEKHEDLSEEQKTIEIEEYKLQEVRQKKAAEEVVRNNKRSTRGKGIVEKAITERTELLNRVRLLRETGGKDSDFIFEEEGSYSPEVLFLMGQIGVTYVKQGVGNIVDVVESVQKHFPEAEDADVWRALNTKNPAHKKREKTVAEKRVRNVKKIANLLTQIEDIQAGIPPGIQKKGNPTGQVKKLSKTLSDLRREYYKSELDVTKKEKAIDKLNEALENLKTSELALEKEPFEVPNELDSIRNLTREVNAELKAREEIADFEEQKRTGNYKPLPVREKKPVSDRLKKVQLDLAKTRSEIRQLVEDAEVLSEFEKLRKKAQIVTSEIRAIKATADVSFTLRQNFWPIFGSSIWTHPVETAKNVLLSFEAAFSQNTAEEITNSIRQSDNAPLYQIHKLEIMDPGAISAQKFAEVFRGRIENLKWPGTDIQWLPGAIMSASNRQSVAIGNLIRSSAFDYFLEKRPNSVAEELDAMADYINKSTGLGDLAFLGRTAPFFREVMFSPRFAVSRFQTPWSAVKYRHLPNVRNKIALDSVRVASVAGLVFMLAKMSGFDVELLDTDSPDWLKIRIPGGDTRYDILGGILQPIRYVANIVKHTTKSALRLEEKKVDWNRLFFNFWWYKMAPAYSSAGEIINGHTVVGEEISRTETLVRLSAPLIAEAIWDTANQEPSQTIPVGLATFMGLGADTYMESFTSAQRYYNMLLRAKRFSEARIFKAKFNRRRKKNSKKLSKERE